MSNKLKPCPKCGGQADIHRQPYEHAGFERLFGKCRDCGHQNEQGVVVPEYAPIDELLTAGKIAVTRWNQRHGDES